MAKNKNNSQEELHELEAERNALESLLFHSLTDAVAHLENVVGALLITMPEQEHAEMGKQLQAIENLDPFTQGVVALMGEDVQTPDKKSTRAIWQDRLVAVKAQIEELQAVTNE